MVKWLLTVGVLFLSISLSAQNHIKQGKVVFDITYKNLPALIALQQDALPKQQVVYFKDSLIRIESSSGGQSQNITIQNTVTGNIYVLLNLYNKKFALIKHDSDLIALKKEFGLDTAVKNISITVVDTALRKIAGFNCKKAIIYKNVNGINTRTECWFTEDLPPLNKHNNDEFSSINGFLLQYTLSDNGIYTTFKARQVTEIPLQYSFFSIPNDYEVVTEEQLVKLLNYYKSQYKDSGY